MSDDDNDRRRGKRRLVMSDDDRANAGAERRRQQMRPISAPVSYPVEISPDDEITEPERVLARGVTDLDLEILRRLGIPADKPVTFRDLAAVLNREYRRDLKHESGNRELGEEIRQLRELLETPPHEAVVTLQNDVREIRDDIDAIRADLGAARGDIDSAHAQVDADRAEIEAFKSKAKWAQGVAVTAIVAALGGIGTFAAKIWARAEAEGEAAIRLQHVERDLAQLRQDFREDRSRDRQPKDTP